MMNLKQLVAAATMAGAFSAAAMGVGAGLANAAPPSAPAGGQAIRADPVARAGLDRVDPDPADLGRADPVGPVGPVGLRADPMDTVALDPATSTAARVGLRAHPADPADPVTRVDLRAQARAGPVAHGTGMTSVATSAARPGARGPHLGEQAHRRGRTGAGRSRRPGGNGMMARSTTGATRKRPSGIPASISGASTSSESGSRCDLVLNS
jgi:hypothetical protein